MLTNFSHTIESMDEIPVHLDLTEQPDWSLLKTPAELITPEYIFDLECSKTEKRMREENPDKYDDDDDLLWEVDALVETVRKNEKHRKTAKRLLEGCTDDLDMVKRVCLVK